jgi:hypothetical protein
MFEPRPPVVSGLILCQKKIVEEGTHHHTLVNSFKRLEFASFPTHLSFIVYTILTDARGEGTLTVRTFLIQVDDCPIADPGSYQVSLDADRQLIAQCVFSAFQRSE